MLQEICMLLLVSLAIYFMAVNFIYVLMMVFSWIKIKKFHKDQKRNSSELPPVSYIIPAYNEASLIVETIQTYLSLPQEKKEIIVIDDGSQDQTIRLLQTMFQLKKSSRDEMLFESITRPELKILKAPHQGKAQALNLGITYSSYDLICTMDADTIPEGVGVEACLNSFQKNPQLIAAGGVIQVLSAQVLKGNQPLISRSKEWANRFQRIEYLRTFVCERLGWSYLGSTLLISGAFCMLRKEALKKIGGFCHHSITEDFDMIVRLRRAYPGRRHRFMILPVTTCYTQVPRTLPHLARQRMRWQMGLVQTLLQNSALFFRPSHGILGLITIPYFWLVEALSPVMVCAAYIVLPFALIQGWASVNHALIYLTLGLFLNLFITVFGIMLDIKYVSRHKNWSMMKGILDTLLIHFGYKQLNTWWRLNALFRSLSKNKTWGEKPREEIIHQAL